MKTKKYERLFFALFICGIMVLSLFLFTPSKVSAEEDSSPAVAVVNSDGKTESGEKQYSYNKDGQNITLRVINFEFKDTDSVAYYYMKQGTNAVAYKYLGTMESSYKDKDGKVIENQYREITKNFFIEAGAGEFVIKAVVLRDGKVFALTEDLKITIAGLAMNGLDVQIARTDYGVVGGSYASYNFKVVLFKKDGTRVDVDLSKYHIEWSYNLDGKDHFFGNGDSIDWTPSQDGDYIINANVYYGTGNQYVTGTTDLPNISKNYTIYAIIVLGGIAVVLTIIVVITTVRKVKKERVW